MQERKDSVRFRLLEIVLTLLVSAGGSAMAVTWSVSANLTKMQLDIEALKTKQATQDATISNLVSSSQLQQTQSAVADANYKNIILQLSEIKEELKKRR